MFVLKVCDMVHFMHRHMRVHDQMKQPDNHALLLIGLVQFFAALNIGRGCRCRGQPGAERFDF